MEKKHFTTSEFANLHNINKRTLHYYDNIGLFSPEIKGENNYRYYSFSQSIKLDYILMLKKVGMSIDEIKLFLQNPFQMDQMRNPLQTLGLFLFVQR